jgi:hypothetical protein
MKSRLTKFRKTAVAALFSVGAICTSASAETLNIGVLLPSPIADVGWSKKPKGESVTKSR